MFRYIIVFVCFGATFDSLAQEKWVLKKHEDGIRVYNRSTENSRINAVRVTCELDGSLSQLTALLLDAKAREKWVYNTTTSHVVKQVSPHQQIYYSKINFPWPLSDRDVVVLMTFSQHPATKILSVTMDAIEGDVNKKDGIIRVPNSSVSWTIKPAKGKMQVEYVAHADPGGNVPAWIANSFSTKGPLETFKRLKSLVRANTYASADFAFIED